MILTYWKFTQSPLYSFIFTIPLFFIYEIGVFLTKVDDMLVLRNGADALMRQILENFGIIGLHGIGAVFLIVFLAVFFMQRKYWRGITIYGNFLLIMMFESLIWAIILYLLMSNIYILLMNPSSQVLIQQVTLSVGAGIYEELFFRVLLISGLASILGFVFQWPYNYKMWVAMIISSGIFSAFHFIGEYSDYFSFDIFLIRFFAGMALGYLYFIRGFGITAWAHSIYDLIVLTQTTTQN